MSFFSPLSHVLLQFPSNTIGAPLHIDSPIRDWVLFPLVIIMLLFTTIRDYLYQIMGIGASAAKSPSHLDYSLLQTPKQQKVFQQMQTLRCAQLLQMNGNYLPMEAFLRLKALYVRPPTKNQELQDQENSDSSKSAKKRSSPAGLLHQKIPNMSLSQLTDPNKMTGMMKQQVMNIVPNLAMWAIVSQFFSGYIVAKFPFSLTAAFRPMVQRGIEHLQLDVSYVTSASLYFLILFGLQGVGYLLRGNQAVNASSQMMKQQTFGMMGGGSEQPGAASQALPHPQQQIPDMGKAFQTQIDNLDMVQYEFQLENEEEKLLARLEKRFKK